MGANENPSPPGEDAAASVAPYVAVKQTPPRTHLETFSLGEMRKVVAAFLFIVIISLVFGTTVLAFTFVYRLDMNADTRFDLFVECVLRTIASALLTFGLLAFPQRIIRARISSGTMPTPTEWILLLALVLCSIIPGFSVYGVVMSWIGATDFIRNVQLFFDTQYDLSFNVLLFTGGDEGFIVSAISSALGIVFQYGFQFLLIDYEAYPKEFEAEAQGTTTTSTSTGAKLKRGYWDRGENITLKEHPYEPLLRVKRAFTCMQARLARMRFLSAWFIIICYLVALLTLSIKYEFYPSYVPFISLITVIRVCSEDSAEWTNATLRQSRAWNSTIQIVSGFSSEYALCSPNQDDNSPFWIAMGCGLFLFFDILLASRLYVSIPRAHEHLSIQPYLTARPYYLGFVYFRFLTWYSFLFLFIMGLLTTTVLPTSSFMVPRYAFDKTNNITSLYVQPMFQVGVTAGNFGFGSCFLIISTWVVFLCYGNLPPDSKGQFAWWCAAKKRPLEKMKSFARRIPGLANRAPGAQRLPRGMAQRFYSLNSARFDSSQEHVFVELPKGAFLCLEHDINLLEDQNQVPLALRKESLDLLSCQIRSKVFVLETAVLLYHFMSLAYSMLDEEGNTTGMMMASTTGDATPPPPPPPVEHDEETPLSIEDLQKLVEDENYQLELYVKNADSDTHAYVFSSEDRIIITFRGSVSFRNYQTDYDSKEVLFEPALQVRPLVDGFANPLYAGNLASTMPPMVHRGFLRTYDTVKREIYECVIRLLRAKKRVLMVTGHSLGGGLAIVCSFDLAIALEIPPDMIALMTFGSPMAGNLSFSTRFDRVVPCAHRLETANDIITQLPFQNPFNDVTLRGWFHIGIQVLLMPNGNGIIEPTPIELFMMHSTSSSIVAHFRLSYATAMAAWAIRANEMHAKWWNSVIYEFLHFADFSPLPKTLRETLLRDLRRPGIPYLLGHTLYRDMALDTSEAVGVEESAEESGEVLALQFASLAERVARDGNDACRERFNLAVRDFITSQQQLDAEKAKYAARSAKETGAALTRMQSDSLESSRKASSSSSSSRSREEEEELGALLYMTGRGNEKEYGKNKPINRSSTTSLKRVESPKRGEKKGENPQDYTHGEEEEAS